jgi:transposase
MITELEQRLDKGSKNSSVPPSADSPKKRAEATKTRADRRAEVKAKRKDDVERRRGKQPGTPGANLAMRPDPDEIVNHLPTNCGSCGDDLADAPVEDTEYRQVFDIPKPVLGCVEHREVSKHCRCGATTKGTFPASAKAPAVQWAQRSRLSPLPPHGPAPPRRTHRPRHGRLTRDAGVDGVHRLACQRSFRRPG